MLKFEVIEELKPNTEILETIKDYTYNTWIQSKNYFFSVGFNKPILS